MSGHNVNIYFQEKTYNKIKPLIKQRKVSEFVNKLVERELEKEQKQEKEQLRKRLIAAYKRESKNQALQEELAIWDEISGDGLDDE
jgi:macrodomain Ter protein organizer (MatP/YcbG family)